MFLLIIYSVSGGSVSRRNSGHWAILLLVLGRGRNNVFETDIEARKQIFLPQRFTSEAFEEFIGLRATFLNYFFESS